MRCSTDRSAARRPRSLLQDVHIEDYLADLALELLDVFVLEGFLVLRPRAQSVLGSQQEPLFPVLDLGHGESMLAGGLLAGGLALENAQDQGCSWFGRPTLDVFGDEMDSSRDSNGINVPELPCAADAPGEEESEMQSTTIAVDLAKSVLEVAVSERPGQVTERHRFSRGQFSRFLAERAPATIVMEACGTAHFWGREAQRARIAPCSIRLELREHAEIPGGTIR